MALTKGDICSSLRQLGVQHGTILMVHSSLSALGEVEHGPDTLIDALLEIIGPSGTLCMPAMSGEQPFRTESSPSNVGIVTERFRHWPGVKRGLHPTHSVSCLGPKADEIIAGHIDQPTALGPDSPWGRIARMEDGYVLLLGADQDRNTLLHCAEEAVDAPYLSPLTRTYIDADGNLQTKELARFPGPHRDFIGLTALFREAGVLTTGKVGRALCQLMHAGRTLELSIAALRKDPAAVLCDNPNCADCVEQRAAIARHRLAQEDFTLTALVDDLGLGIDRIQDALGLIANRGIETVEFGPLLTSQLITLAEEPLTEVRALLSAMGMSVSMVSCVGSRDLSEAVHHSADLAKALGATLVKLPPIPLEAEIPVEDIALLVQELGDIGLTLVIENQEGTFCDTKGDCEAVLASLPGVDLAFNPANFAHVEEHPFLYTFYKGKLKHRVRQLYITDGCRPGGDLFTLPGQGNGEVKELMSILRCRGFDGFFCLKTGSRIGVDEFKRQCDAFRHLIETL